jgi:predicted metal-dependent phosphotriesterase family hydrolase
MPLSRSNLIRHIGLTEAQVDQLTIHNPRRALAAVPAEET